MSGFSNESPNGSRRALQPARGKGGFTMAELLAVIAVLAIMAAIAFVSISAIQRNAQQAELDGTAREIFIAAQNHLSAADAQGMLLRKSDKGVQVDGEDGVYYYAVGDAASRALLDSSNNVHNTGVLYQMLPLGSLDDTVRMDGTYVIKYDLESATVLDVFYARSGYSTMFAANTGGFAFADADYDPLFDDPGYTGADKKQARQGYASAGGQTVMVGYYGGEDIDAFEGGVLQRPALRVVNAERLTAIVKNPNWGVDVGQADEDKLEPTLRLVVTGELSGKSKVITLVNKGVVDTAPSFVESNDGGKTFYVFLDDVTVRGGHFAEIFAGDGLVPGEDVTVRAVASSTSRLANVAESTALHRNSLFASLLGVRAGSGSQGAALKARVANIRHLENLSGNVSGYDPSNTAWGGAAPTSAEQVRDLSWPAFQMRIVEPAGQAGGSDEPDADTVAARAEAASKVRAIELYAYSGEVREGSFMPVSPAFALSYDGRSHRIGGVAVDRDAGNVGVFGDLNGAYLHDLSIVNCSARTGAGDSGALAGALSGASSVVNAVAFNEVSASGAYGSVSTDATLEMTGTSSVGGLVGSMRGGSIENSAAAVYVRSTGGSAGGLLGWTDGATSIAGSYAGGHTREGAFSESTAEGEAGRVNVIAAVNAGGLVGNAAGTSDLSISSCYSTASVYGGDLTGGLVGYLGGGSIANSYAAAVVGAAEGVQRGVFAGGSGGSVAFAGNSYLEMLNDPDQMNGLGTDAASAEAADSGIEAYGRFASATSKAYPYDATLMELYQGSYSFKTISELSGAADLPLHARVHFGDWPALETLVVNSPL